MKIENLLFSLFVMAIAICSLAALGWMTSFIVGNEISSADGSAIGDFHMFSLRVFIGLMFIGLLSGIYKLWDLFVFCMKGAPTK
jgi:hypothetical protein